MEGKAWAGLRECKTNASVVFIAVRHGKIMISGDAGTVKGRRVN